LIQQAAGEFEAALKTKLSEGAKWRAVHQLGAIYAALGQDREADVFYRRYVSMMEGTNRAFALQRYAGFLFTTHNIDGAIATAREMQRIADFPLGRQQLAIYLSIKGGMLRESGHAKEAKPFFAEAQQYEPDLETLCPNAGIEPCGPARFGRHSCRGPGQGLFRINWREDLDICEQVRRHPGHRATDSLGSKPKLFRFRGRHAASQSDIV
jgi:tetratricopeptide (TPR) repeat protein